MILKLKVLLFFTFTTIFAFAQQKNDPLHPLSIEDEIKKLKDGVLLVRLQTKENSIAALKKGGQNEQAHKIEVNQSRYNKDIVSAFKNNFSFCPVYFFLSSYSDNIKSKQFNQIVFVNDSLEADSAIHLKNNNFLTAEFGIIEQDTAQFINDTDAKGKKSYRGGNDMKFDALKIMSDQLIQLRSPFPYYIRIWAGTPFERPLSKVVSKMNDRLFNFYKKATSF